MIVVAFVGFSSRIPKAIPYPFYPFESEFQQCTNAKFVTEVCFPMHSRKCAFQKLYRLNCVFLLPNKHSYFVCNRRIWNVCVSVSLCCVFWQKFDIRSPWYLYAVRFLFKLSEFIRHIQLNGFVEFHYNSHYFSNLFDFIHCKCISAARAPLHNSLTLVTFPNKSMKIE